MNRLRVLLPLILACCPFLGSFLVYRALKQKAVPEKVAKEETVPVAVALNDLPWGAKLTREMIQVVPYLRQSLPPDCFSDASALEGRVVIASLKQNEPIIESKLAPTDVTTGGVPAILRPGRRAVAVKGNPVLGVAGFIRPETGSTCW